MDGYNKFIYGKVNASISGDWTFKDSDTIEVKPDGIHKEVSFEVIKLPKSLSIKKSDTETIEFNGSEAQEIDLSNYITKEDIKNKLDVLGTEEVSQGPYNMIYYISADYETDKITANAKTISMDNEKTLGDYHLDINGAVASVDGEGGKAGLLIATDKEKISKAVLQLGNEEKSGEPYHFAYYYGINYGTDKINAYVKTITLDNNKTIKDYDLDINSATTKTAGLMSATDKINLDKSIVYGIELTGKSGTLSEEQRTILKSGSPTNNFIDKDNMIFHCIFYGSSKAVYGIGGEAKNHCIEVTLESGAWVLTTYNMLMASNVKAGDNITITEDSNGNITISASEEIIEIEGTLGEKAYEGTLEEDDLKRLITNKACKLYWKGTYGEVEVEALFSQYVESGSIRQYYYASDSINLTLTVDVSDSEETKGKWYLFQSNSKQDAIDENTDITLNTLTANKVTLNNEPTEDTDAVNKKYTDSNIESKIKEKVISGEGAPTTSTVGTVGLLYEDTTNGKLYQCTSVDGETYSWIEILKKTDLAWKQATEQFVSTEEVTAITLNLLSGINLGDYSEFKFVYYVPKKDSVSVDFCLKASLRVDYDTTIYWSQSTSIGGQSREFNIKGIVYSNIDFNSGAFFSANFYNQYNAQAYPATVYGTSGVFSTESINLLKESTAIGLTQTYSRYGDFPIGTKLCLYVR